MTRPSRVVDGRDTAAPPLSYAVVVPTLLRDTLADCLGALAAATGPPPDEIVLVDDRPVPDHGDLGHPLDVLGDLRSRTTVARSRGHGPAVARNAGLRGVRSADWVVFLDDDVQVGPHWCEQAVRDLAEAPPTTAGVQGVITVPLPGGRRPTDCERRTVGLATARWITSDMAYRTDVLREVGGFDERFRHAQHEDTDLALRVLDAGWGIRRGRRTTRHPVRPADRWDSLHDERGNADDALMVRLHGPDWWYKTASPRGRIRAHAAVTSAGVAACALLAVRRPAAAGLAAGVWTVGTARFAWKRIAPGPRTRYEVDTMLVTSVLIPPAAVCHRLGGLWRHRAARPWREVTGSSERAVPTT
ncbi:glycosyltransferase family 2 protein [Streptomyces sp. NPDC056468]|uniref:glycosyltransferase family 2 protein n=1 Tax=Streptomyces sp. NPDC056468 TaxID=3345830 RepID=UPI0036A4B290